MRAEDLFKAMEGIDDELILQSELKIEASQVREDETTHETKRKAKSSRARFHRFFRIAATTAAAVFLLLMARELAGSRGAQTANSSKVTSNVTAQSQDEQLMAEAADAPEAVEEAAAETAQEDAMPETFGADASQQAEESAQSDNGGAVLQEEEAADESAPDKALAESGTKEAESAGKTAVDLLGDHADEYVGLEYISAEEEANGGERKVPDYTKAGELALTAALESGKAQPSVLANTGKPVYYVYLTRKGGEVNTATFYENGYVGLDSFPGFVMKISDAEYEAVLKLFR